MTAVNFPRTTFQILRGQQLVESVEHRTLIIGQKTSSGSAVAGALNESAPESNAAIASLFGARSHVAQMLRAFKAINQSSAVDVIALDDNAGGTAATATFTAAGTATELGPLFVQVASGAQRTYRVDVEVGDQADEIGTKLAAAITADTTAPFTAVNVAGTVTVTAANDGTLANSWHIAVNGNVGGITSTLVGWTGGANDPTVNAAIFDVIQGRRYQTIVWPEVYTDTVVETLLNDRFNVSDDILQGVAITTSVDTAANIQAKATALNSQSVVVFPSKAVDRAALRGNALREMPDVVSARFAALRSLRLTDDAALAQFLTTPAPLDQFGGRALASLPYANTVCPNQSVVDAEDLWTSLEISTFRDNGVAAIGPNRNFSSMLFGEVVTTNTTDEAANADDSFKFLNTVDTIAAVRDSFFLNCRTRYAQTRLTDGDLLAGRDMANQASIEAFTEEIHQSLADDALVQSGAASLTAFKTTGRVVAVDVAAGRVSIDVAPLLVNGMRIIVGTVAVNFGT